MGRNSSVSCATCRKDYDIGYGSSRTWLDQVDTVAAFDAQLVKYGLTPETLQGRNRCVWAFLVEHEGHEFDWWSSDYAFIDDKGDLRGDYDNDLILEGVGGYEKLYGRRDGTFTSEPPGALD
jgi:hypothetical protein